MKNNITKNAMLIGAIAAGLALSSVSRADSGVPIHGFADVGVGYAGKNMQERLFDRGFFVSNLDLFFNPDLGNVKMLAELIIDATEGSVVVDSERLQIGYVLNNNFTIHMGRFHTPIGAWNTSYHHGAQIQTSVYKPRFIDFEDKVGVIPTHTVGLLLTGATDAGRNKFGYDFTIGNGSRIIGDAEFTTGDMQMGGDIDHDVALGTRLYYAFNSGTLDGLTVGVHGLKETITTDADVSAIVGGTHATDIQMMGGYFSFENHGIEWLSEYYSFSDKDHNTANAAAVTSSAYYTQFGYALNEHWLPYVRYEKTDFDQADAYFADQTYGASYDRIAVGLRHNLTDKACIKVEGNKTNIDQVDPSGVRAGVPGGEYQELRAQFAVRF